MLKLATNKIIEYGILILVLLFLLFATLCNKTHTNNPVKIKKFLLYKASNNLEKTTF